jgi:hypothetical protein
MNDVRPVDLDGPTGAPFRPFPESWLGRPVFDILAETASIHADKTAIDDGYNFLTYGEVHRQARNLADRIARIAGRGAPVGIALPNGSTYPVAMLACLGAGCPYVPLDLSFPEARNTLILKNSGMKAVIVDEDTGDMLTRLHPDLPQLDYGPAPRETETALPGASPDDVAVIFYTSGSTGTPKGVYYVQRAVLHYAMLRTNTVHLSQDDRVLLVFAPMVVVAQQDIFGALLNGAQLFVVDVRRKELSEVVRLMRGGRITLYHSANETALAVPQRRLNLLADGDSWFDYPLTDGLPIGSSDIIHQLQSLITPAPEILNLAHHGDATTALMGVSKRNELMKQLHDPNNGHFDAILFSGGGNDLVGDQFRLWLQDEASAGGDPTKAVDQQALSDILGVVVTAYRDLLAARDSMGHDIPIFVHAYDLALPTNIGVCGNGPWLFPSLQSRSWMNDTNPWDLAKGAAIVKLILIEFEKQMRSLSTVPGNNVVYIETQGTLVASEWANDLHPTPGGFKKIAQQFVGPLTDRFSDRAAIAPVAMNAGRPGVRG